MSGIAEDAPKWKEVQADKVEMVYVECPDCRYHMGVDFTYLDQVGPAHIICPACGTGGIISDEPEEPDPPF